MACAKPVFLVLSITLSIFWCQSGLGQTLIRAATIRPASPVQIQQPTLVAGPNQSIPNASPGNPADPGNPEATAEQKPEDVLVQQLLATQFDRTVQSVLKAWSSLPEKGAGSAEQSAPEAFDAKVTNAFESVLVLTSPAKPNLKANEVIDVASEGKTSTKAKILSVEGNTIVAKLIPPPTKKESPSIETKPAGAKSPAEPPAQPTEKPTEQSADPTAPESATATDAVETEDPNPEADKPEDIDANTIQEKGSEAETDEETKTDKSPDSKAEETAANSPSGDATASTPRFSEGESVVLTLANDKKREEKSATEIATAKVKQFSRDVALGNWDNVKSFLAELTPDNADKVYAHLLTSLAVASPVVPEGISPQMAQQLAQMNGGQQQNPANFLTPNDILELTEAAPKPIEIFIKKEDDKSADEKSAAKPASPSLPPGIQLPPGVTFDSLPPEVKAQIQQVPAGPGAPDGQPISNENTTPNHIAALANLIRVASKDGHDFSPFIERLKEGTKHFGLDNRIKQLTTADLLLKSGMLEFVEDFLPSLDQETTQDDVPALKVWSTFALRMYSQKKVADWLEKSWQINQWIVAFDKTEKSDRDKALTNLIELSAKVDKELGQKWLNASFTEQPERGKMILTNLGTKSATMAKQAASVSESERLKLLRLQNAAVENLLKVSPDTANEWSQAMTLLAQNWLTESETSIRYSKQNSRQQFMQIDMYGNYYWVDQDQLNQRYGGRRNPRPIKIGDMLEAMPSESWRKHVSTSLHTQLRKITANLHLRVNEEDKAFPYIEQIAVNHPTIARDLIHEFLRIWTRNHDPNTDKRQRNPYIFSYGFDQKADAIPLTRSKQERNLAELSQWVERIRKMELEDVDEQLLADAFTTCHSSAEVFRLDAVKAVFGDLADLKPATIAAICQKIRVNLSSNWRDIRNQEAKQTKRREPEVQQEVLRGYQVGLELAAEALKSAPDDWQLHLAKACLMFDQNAYSQTVQKSSEFSDKRDIAFGQFQMAADKYASVLPSLEQKDQSTSVYDYWFYAALGACDLGKITDKTVPDLRQYPKIKEAIDSLSGNLAEIHMSKFANNMFTRMSPIKPEIKFRYLRGGFVIVGDHPRAWEASNLYDYYKDLVSEIKLQVEIDGSEDVGHEQPFGIYVNLLHTSEIERESGGFSKYVQNQNNNPYAFNYGRPNENYRDKFTDAVKQALDQHFEVLNVTFQSADSMQSIAAPQAGWRLTSFAYILLKPLGSEIDRIAPLKIDMDFLDTSGYVVIPVESPAVVIDASSKEGVERPVTELQITQTLDERQASESRLILEVSATGKGLVPELESLIDLNQENFEVVSIDDQGVLPSTFDKDADGIQILSDRSWTIEYQAVEGKGINSANQFEFSEAKVEQAANKFQRYEDADLVEVDQRVDLEMDYGTFSWAFLYWLIPTIVLGLAGIAATVYMLTRPAVETTHRFNVPEDINPFTVLTLLKDIKQRNGISDEKANELEQSIHRVEEYYFGKTRQEDIDEDLSKLASRWVQQAT